MSRQGLKAMRQGDWTMAETLFADALEVSDENDAAHRGLAEAYWQKGESSRAIEHLEKAVQRSAGDPKQMQRLGEMYLETGRLDDAKRQCEIALRTERDYAPLWALWGDCHFEQRRNERALEAYHRALALQPQYPHVQLQVAEIYLQQNRHDRLLATLDRLPEAMEPRMPGQANDRIRPGRADCLRGIAMRVLDRPDEAARFFERAIQKEPGDVTPRLHLASLALQRGQAQKANELLASAMAIDPDGVRAQRGYPTGLDADAATAASLAVRPDTEDKNR
ncbi:MAG: tetratricopeptide repeat protein [Planctomycetota bacterium]